MRDHVSRISQARERAHSDGAFTKALRDHWIPNPRTFVGGVESLWKAMNEGGEIGRAHV
jgi:hypothetical protein